MSTEKNHQESTPSSSNNVPNEVTETNRRKSSPAIQTTCNTARTGLKKFAFSENEGVYVLVGDASEEEVYGSSRLRQRSLSTGRSFLGTTSTSPIFPQAVRNDRALDVSDEVIYGRWCYCAKVKDAYCPVGAELCRIVEPNPFTSRVQCEGEVQGMAGRYLFPLVLFMYLFFAGLLLGSPQGKYARGHIKKLLRCWDDDRYEEDLGLQIDRMVNRAHQRRARGGSSTGRNPHRVYYNSSGDPLTPYMPRRDYTTTTTAALQVAQRIAVGLKTRSYKTTAEENVTECAICLSEFKSGERVGNLMCGHVFHVEPCLKKWIVRKNHCPLCHDDKLAAPQTNQEPVTDTPPNTAVSSVASTEPNSERLGAVRNEIPATDTENIDAGGGRSD